MFTVNPVITNSIDWFTPYSISKFLIHPPVVSQSTFNHHRQSIWKNCHHQHTYPPSFHHVCVTPATEKGGRYFGGQQPDEDEDSVRRRRRLVHDVTSTERVCLDRWHSHSVEGAIHEGGSERESLVSIIQCN